MAHRSALALACAVLLAAAPAAAAPLEFAPFVGYYSAGDQSESVAVGDFNGDGIRDLVTGVQTADNLPVTETAGVNVMLGYGTGSFHPARLFSAGPGNSPRAVVTGLFNDDRKLDVATANLRGDSVSVLLGDGAGGLKLDSTIGVKAKSRAIAAGDFNADGETDLVVAHRLSTPDFGQLSVLLGKGNGRFTRLDKTILVGDSPTAIAVGQLNGDKRPDLAIAQNGFNNVRVLFGKGGGKFGDAVDLFAGSRLSDVKVARVNAGKAFDVVATGGQAGQIFTWLGNGKGKFGDANGKPLKTPTDKNCSSFTLANFDAAGSVDAALSCFGHVLVHTGTGSGKFTTPVELFYPGGAPEATVAADLDKNGRLDVIGSSVYVHMAVRHAFDPGAFSRVGHVGVPGELGGVATGDFAGSGAHDLAVPVGADFREVAVPIGDGTGAFAEPAPRFPVGGPARALAAGDLNAEPKQDLVFAGPEGLRVLPSSAGGVGAPLPFEAPGGAHGVALGRLDGDATLDVAATVGLPSANGGTVDVRTGTGAGDLRGRNGFETGPSPRSVAVGNFDGDLHRDLVVANTGSASLTVLYGRADGSFGERVDLPVGEEVGNVVARDLNNDGRGDIVAVRRRTVTDDAMVWISSPAGFGEPLAYPLALANFPPDLSPPLAVGDLDGDSTLDILSADYTPPGPPFSRITVLRGTGAGTFGTPVHIPVAFGQDNPFVGVAIGDFDASGTADVGAAHQRDAVAVLMGQPGLPPPELFKSANLYLKFGTVFVKCGSQPRFQLRSPAHVPLVAPTGCLVNARGDSAVTVETAADAAGTRQRGDFARGAFRVTQGTQDGQPWTVVKLNKASRCTTSAPAINYVGAVAEGRWRMIGTYGRSEPLVASHWAMSERCRATAFSVSSGKVSVYDNKTRRTRELGPNGKYTARP